MADVTNLILKINVIRHRSARSTIILLSISVAALYNVINIRKLSLKRKHKQFITWKK